MRAGWVGAFRAWTLILNMVPKVVLDTVPNMIPSNQIWYHTWDDTWKHIWYHNR